ncbi:MAG: type I secretion system permease/ATPase [Pseudomonadota bacterium]
MKTPNLVKKLPTPGEARTDIASGTTSLMAGQSVSQLLQSAVKKDASGNSIPTNDSSTGTNANADPSTTVYETVDANQNAHIHAGNVEALPAGAVANTDSNVLQYNDNADTLHATNADHANVTDMAAYQQQMQAWQATQQQANLQAWQAAYATQQQQIANNNTPAPQIIDSQPEQAVNGESQESQKEQEEDDSEKENVQAIVDWRVKPSFESKDDPLLGCLMIICSMLDRNSTAESLTAGMPLADDKMSPELFIRSAERENISAKLVRRTLSSITPAVLPCVMLLEGRRAIVVSDIDREKEVVRAIFPDAGTGEENIPIKELKKSYSGYAIFARPKFRFDLRSDEKPMVKAPKGWFWGAILSMWPFYVEVLIASVLVNILMIIAPLFMMNVYDRVIPHQAFDTLFVLASGVFMGIGFNFSLMILRGYLLELAGRSVHQRASARLYQQLLNMRLTERGQSIGGLAERIQSFSSLRQFFANQTLVQIIDVPFGVLFLIVIYIIGGPLFLVPLISVTILCLCAYFVHIPMRKNAQQEGQERQQSKAIITEVIAGLETVKSTGAENRLQRDWELFNETSSLTQMRSNIWMQAVMALMMSMHQFNMVCLVIFGVYLISENTITMGAMLACNMLSMRVLMPMTRVAGLLMRLHQTAATLKSLNEIMECEVERPEGRRFVHRKHYEGNLTFSDVVFSYPESEAITLDHVSFSIKKGERVGIIGKIGSGKSTLERLCLGLYEPDEGSVFVDDVDVRQLDPAELRRNIGTVPQEVYLFYGTLRENIVLAAPYADDAMVLRAAYISGVQDFASQHPQGMDMEVGERGENLSGGQRQAVALARAFLVDPPILLMDEPTSAMDKTSQTQFMRRLEETLEDRTLILITHRFAMLEIVNRLIVLDQGKIIADGPKEQVLEGLDNGSIQPLSKSA